ncbi:MAG: hypothetical protein JO217_14095 [Acidobacteriaceae bacterium]|nr:hypothetical protein [Acidobacteriaceae bacterium]
MEHLPIGQVLARIEADLDRLNAIVEAVALKASARAVLCSVWVHDREVMIAARGWSSLIGLYEKISRSLPRLLADAVRVRTLLVCCI